MAALFTVPLGNALPWYTFRITFSSAIYTMEVRYNTRMNRWVVNINDPSNNPILEGIVLLIERNLTGQYPTLALPPGIFFVSDDTGQGTEPTQFSFGTDHTCWYEDPNS